MLENILTQIKPLDKTMMDLAQKRLDSLTKPLGSLGRLEDITKQIVGITGELYPKVDNKKVIIMCADNGVFDEGVSSCPKEVTASVTRNFTRGITGINTLTRHCGADIYVIDIGVDDEIECKGVHDCKVRRGTWNIAKGPAMTRDEAHKCIEIGIEAVRKLKNEGVNLLGTGEMGICNTSTSSAVAAVLIGAPIEEMVGKGSGMTQTGYKNKIETVKKAIEINKPDPKDPIDVLAKLGGFDIAGLVGCYLGAALYRIPILLDGFISGAAALLASAICPPSREFMIPSHGSAEPGSKYILKALGFEPMLNLGMRLGEGTGAAIAFNIVDAAVYAYTHMGTFDDARIEQYKPLE